MQPVSGKPQLNRKINASLVLDLIQSKGTLSRADLVKLTGIRATSVSAIVQQLLDENLLREVGLGKSTGGRQPTLLQLNPEGLFAAGMDVADGVINGVIVDLGSNVLAARSIELPDTDPVTVVKYASKLLTLLCRRSRIKRKELSGLGVAVPGIVSRDGVVLLSRPLGWKNVPFREALTARLEIQGEIALVNNATAGALDAFFAEGFRASTLFYVLLYVARMGAETLTNIGCGIIIDGRAYLGDGRTAGEIRTQIDHPLAQAQALDNARTPKNFEQLIALSSQVDTYSDIWQSFAVQIGTIITNGIDLLSPGRVVIGTDRIELQTLIGSQLQDAVERNTVAGLLAELEGEQKTPSIEFRAIDSFTLAKGAIVPRLRQLSLAPLLRASVLM